MRFAARANSLGTLSARLRHVAVVTIAIAALGRSARAQDGADAGARVRALVEGRWVVGTLLERSADSIVIRTDIGRRRAVATSRIRRFQREEGRSRLRGAINGALIGAGVPAIGGLIGSGLTHWLVPQHANDAAVRRWVGNSMRRTVPLGVIVGAAAGAPRWRTVEIR